MAFLSPYKPTDDEEEPAGRSEEMQRPGAARSSTSPAPIVGTPQPDPAADATQIRSAEAGRNAVAKPPDEDARRPSPVSPGVPAASTFLPFASAASAFGNDLDLVLSRPGVSASGEDDASLPLDENYATYEAMEEGTVPNARGKRGIISDREDPTPTAQAHAEDEDNTVGEGTRRAWRMQRWRGGIEYIDDEPPKTHAQMAEAYAEMDAAVKNLQSSIRPVLQTLPPGEIAARIASANNEMDAVITSQGQTFAQNGAAYSEMDTADLDDADAADELSTPPANQNWELHSIEEDEATPMAPRPLPSPAVPQAAGGRGLNLPTSGQRQAESPILPSPRSMLASSNDASDAESQSTEVFDVDNVQAPIEATLVQSVEATLILNDEREVVIAERVSFVERTKSLERKWKVVNFGIVIFLVILVVSLSVMLTNAGKETELVVPQSDVPSMQPSSPPSFDPRPTLEIVQTRRNLRCGVRQYRVDTREVFDVDMCRAIAAVILGNPDNIVLAPVTFYTRFQQLRDKTIDVLINSDTRTVEREVRERSTGTGFTFSSTYYYDGMAYFGDEAFVRCAEKRQRYDECSSLLICTSQGSTGYNFLRSSFPSDFYLASSSLAESREMLSNNTCNVMASDRSILFLQQTLLSTTDKKSTVADYVVGNKLMTKEPLAIVTRNDDAEFSDVINWVVQSLFYAEEQSLTNNTSKCQSYTNLTADVSDLIFSNAFYCVGSYRQIMGSKGYEGMNRINNGTTGMLYAIPFGELEHNYGVPGDTDAIVDDTLLGRIRYKGSLNCGVIAPDGFTGEDMTSKELFGMNVDYCHTLAAALFNGKGEAVNITILPGKGNNSFIALDNGTIDVLAGARVEQKLDFRSSSPLLRGFHFSTPYYYGNETAVDDVSFFSLATRDDNVLFSSFVNCVVVATIFAAERIKKKESMQFPLVSIFGSEFNWALRDAISYSGSYDDIYTKNFVEEDRGRNSLNDEGTPQIHSFPGIRQ